MNPFEDIEEKITPIVNKATIWLEINKNKKNTFISGLPFIITGHQLVLFPTPLYVIILVPAWG